MSAPPKKKGAAGATPPGQTLDPTCDDESIARPKAIVKPAGYMASHGGKLIAQGYLTIPIRPGEKRPFGKNWGARRMTLADVEREGSFGVGVLTGQGENPICAIDIDVVQPALAKMMTDLCQAELPGAATARVPF